MTASYLDEALRACRLPIRMTYDLYYHGRLDAWQIDHGEFPNTWRERFLREADARNYYTTLRNRLLAEQKENE